MKKIVITTDCVSDISEKIRNKYDIKAIYFYIVTEHGWFRDMDEITSGNIIEYFERGGSRVQTKAPFPEEYREFFEKVLAEGDELIHVSVTSALSMSYQNALVAANEFGGRVHVFDSGHLSSGMTHLVVKASEYARQGLDAKEIVEKLERMKCRVSTSFIAENANYLYRTGLVSKFVKDMCEMLKIHPVLRMRKGVMRLKSVRIGNYEKAVMRYTRGQLRRSSAIEKELIFITHAGCSLKLITKVKKEVANRGSFRDVQVTEASATITSNCGANTIGVLFVRK